MKKKYLVRFNCVIGEYEHFSYCLFDKKLSDYQYCKKFWGLSKKNKLNNSVYWDDWMMNAIEVISVQETTNQESETLRKLMVA